MASESSDNHQPTEHPSVTKYRKAETECNMRIAVAMMATAMEKDGSFNEVLDRPAVRKSILEARDWLSEALGVNLGGV